MPEELTIDQVTPEAGQQEDNTPEPQQDEGQGQVQEKQVTPNYYKPEELESLDPDSLDIERVAPEQKPLFKLVDSVNKKRAQELEQTKREYESRFQQTKTQSQDPLYNSFKTDPFTFKNAVNAEIRKLRNMAEQVDPLAEGAAQYKQKLFGQIDMLEDRVLGYEKQAYQESQAEQGHGKIREIENNVYTELSKAIPNYEKRSAQLKEFATKNLGGFLTEKDINVLTSPGVIYFDANTGQYNFLGGIVTNLVKTLNRAYEIINSEKALKHKENRRPNYVESPGMGNVPQGDKGDRLKQLEQKAIKSGRSDDWTAYIQAQMDLTRKE